MVETLLMLNPISEDTVVVGSSGFSLDFPGTDLAVQGPIL